jgi:hypothetical protein
LPPSYALGNDALLGAAQKQRRWTMKIKTNVKAGGILMGD